MRLVGCLPGGHRSFLPLLSTSGGHAILEEGDWGLVACQLVHCGAPCVENFLFSAS